MTADAMTWWEAVVLGVVQGLTEFLPISSSAHLRVVGELIGAADPGAAFTAITQIGTEVAVLIYFRRDIVRIVTAWWRALRGAHGPTWRDRTGWGAVADPDARMAWFIAIGTVPIVLLGVTFQDSIERPFRNLYVVAAMLAVFGILLGVADRIGRRVRELERLTVWHAIALGFAQALALVPGVSRSGGTITVGLLLGYTREAAARYSFLLAIPAVMGSGFYQLVRYADEFGQAGTPGLGVTFLATVVAGLVGFVVIVAFLAIVTRYSFLPFVVYRLVLAVVVVVLLGTGVLTALPGGA